MRGFRAEQVRVLDRQTGTPRIESREAGRPADLLFCIPMGIRKRREPRARMMAPFRWGTIERLDSARQEFSIGAKQKQGERRPRRLVLLSDSAASSTVPEPPGKSPASAGRDSTGSRRGDSDGPGLCSSF